MIGPAKKIFQPRPGLQAKKPVRQTVGQSRPTPAASTIYRPQPVPRVLQRATATNLRSQVGQVPRQPVAPPVYRPQPPPRVLQTKRAVGFTPATQKTPFLQTMPGRKSGCVQQVIQRMPQDARITGRTHLVRKKNNSVFRGDEVVEVESGAKVTIDTAVKMRSRRGPNQERHRATDLHGPRIYRWFKVLALNGHHVGDSVFVREDAIAASVPLSAGLLSHHSRQRDGSLPRQNVRLIGTIHHSDPSADKSKAVSDEFLSGSDLIVEHPTPMGTRLTQLDLTVRDITQNKLTDRAHHLGTGLIGADGRKVIDRHGQTHSISLRGKPHKIKLTKPYSRQELIGLASEYIDASLGLSPVDVRLSIQKVVSFGRYVATGPSSSYILPDVALVMGNTFKRVRTITEYFDDQVKLAIKKKLLSTLDAELNEQLENTQEFIAALDMHYQEKQATGTLSPVDEVAWDKGKRDYNKQLHRDLISIFHDAISNLSLFSEALASDKPNLVVAFGGGHVGPLDQLMREVHGRHKHYSFEK